MSVYFSNAYVLSSAFSLEAYLPRICWHDLVTVNTIEADQAVAAFPVTNLANPATNLLWKSGSTAAQNLTCLFSYNDDVDYVAIARHNFGSGGISVSIEGLDPEGDPEDDNDWTELVAETLLADDSPALFIFDATTVDGLRLVLTPDSVEPQCAVLQCGASTVLQRGLPISAGHRPIHLARTAETFGPVSQGGDFLGVTELTARLGTTIDLRHLSKSWYDANLKEFALLGKRATFFFAWNAEDYPLEVGYCWCVSDPQPVYSTVPGWVDISFEIGGLAV